MKQGLLFVAAMLTLFGQEPVPFGARVYIHPMDGFGPYLHKAFRVVGVPLEVVGRREGAEYELAGNDEREASANKGIRIPFLKKGEGRNVVSLRLRKVKTGEVVFAKAYGTDKASRGKRGGAERCANDLELKIREQGGRRVRQEPAAVTAVRFTSQPAYADLEVDGEYWGVTPTAELTRLRPGTHVIVVKKYGYERWEQKVELTAGETRMVNAELQGAAAAPDKARISGLE